MRQLVIILLSGIISIAALAASDTRFQKYATPTMIHGLLVSGEVEFYQNDTLEFARIVKDDSLFGHRFPANTGFHFTKSGVMDWCFLGKNWVVQGHPMQGGGHDWMTEFFPSGRLASGGLSEVQTIDGVPCDVGTFWTELFGGGGRTYFYENGKLKYAKVASTVNYHGQQLKKGKHVKLKPDGTIEFVK